MIMIIIVMVTVLLHFRTFRVLLLAVIIIIAVLLRLLNTITGHRLEERLIVRRDLLVVDAHTAQGADRVPVDGDVLVDVRDVAHHFGDLVLPVLDHLVELALALLRIAGKIQLPHPLRTRDLLPRLVDLGPELVEQPELQLEPFVPWHEVKLRLGLLAVRVEEGEVALANDLHLLLERRRAHFRTGVVDEVDEVDSVEVVVAEGVDLWGGVELHGGCGVVVVVSLLLLLGFSKL